MATAGISADETVRAERERTLADIVATTLGRDQVDPHEGFFDAGGDSVLALQVVARAHEAGLALTVRDIFDLQTVAALSERAVEVTAPTGDQLPELSRRQLDEFEDFDEPAAADSGAEWETAP
ncbi:phosphopantetheine-binding protein [Actinokineospora sp. HUAS TT18]|uniref:phosphopantetheine-binding protein n=1 Tax=Actinokineospora sp. HUAS TT18 TaxID=3447451 RepID=UPI003F524C29